MEIIPGLRGDDFFLSCRSELDPLSSGRIRDNFLALRVEGCGELIMWKFFPDLEEMRIGLLIVVVLLTACSGGSSSGATEETAVPGN